MGVRPYAEGYASLRPHLEYIRGFLPLEPHLSAGHATGGTDLLDAEGIEYA